MVFVPLEVDYAALHQGCRSKVVKGMKDAGVCEGIAVLKGGEPSFRHDTDHEHLFRQESHFHYLFGVNEPDLFGALDLATGEGHLFVPRLDVDYEVWCGKIMSNTIYSVKYGIEHVHYVDELETVLQSLAGSSPIHILSGVNSDSKRAIISVTFNFETFSPVTDDSTFFKVMCASRSVKTELELVVMRHVNRLSSLAHINVMRNCKPGMMEFQLEALFLSYTHFEGGCRYQAYTCICGTGENGAILHYGHAAAPNDKQLKDGDMCLLDMGSEFHCYASDITCSYPANGKFTEKQKGIYNIVLAALLAVRNTVREGVEWTDMHILAEKVIVQGLIDLGMLKLCDKTIEDLVDLNIGALFFPHGLGHLMGMETHDVGGYPDGKERATRPGLRSLRMNRPLQAGMVLTNEPGCYFIEALLLPALKNSEIAHHFNEEMVMDYMTFGGVRLEEDIIITETGCENMTDVPRETDEIEKIMAH